MKVKKFLKVIIFAMGIMILLPTKSALAATLEVEPNDTIDTATPVSRCTVTPNDVITGNASSTLHSVSGYLDSADVDWYSATLYTNDYNYFSFLCYSDSGNYSIQLYDSNGVLYKTYSYNNISKSKTFDFEVDSTGTYYIKLTSTTYGQYQFSIGNPVYKVGTYKYTGSALSLTAGTTSYTTMDLTNNSSIPDGAIIYHDILLYGGSRSCTSMRSIKPTGSTTWLDSSSYGKIITVNLNNNYKLKQSWDIKYVANKTETITPENTFLYIYPLLPDTSWDMYW